ncbi:MULTISPECIES: N-methyl-D-aspartate receptor NMDAR2C subunit [unclassified Massilia]|uniref:HD domain-containing protein n=1 Tax=unclassified Massilia TaxID=2609279 RepID=UPI00177F4F2E|nr:MULTISPECIES: N-methyl-D-aspartate receptor NMDAR2C subunit [unclassified Massilia]MBD8529869.1 N-methyl-D-aspartate receptor NMDAR2C subunit [Massilia sp. CFBP 13647]MBD8672119.1 N-methyl-D-aspartate receptor NMDAR2C subunit [Massilia sp. CFBP 13721]
MKHVEERWQQLWQAIGSPPPAGLLDALLAAWREPQRHYHTLQHLEECLDHFDAMRAQSDHACEIELALWFHDAVYDVHAHDNEARSAGWALRALAGAGLAPASCERVAALVMATAAHAPSAAPDAQVLTDIDLAILGAPLPRFAEYERQIRAEYAHVPAALFAAKRKAVLRGFLERARIYQTAHFRTHLESQARANLVGAIGLP